VPTEGTEYLTLQIVHVLSEDLHDTIHEHLETNYPPLLKADVSNYAKGRSRVWLEQEPTLVKDYTLSPAYHDERLWKWLTSQLSKYNWTPQVGLVARGPVGISLHRDATYAQYMGFNINLGEDIIWQYRECYKQFGYGPADNDAPVVNLEVPKGAVIRFCVKNPHGVGSPITDKRWSINLWRLK
jgi:hypothetical protein